MKDAELVNVVGGAISASYLSVITRGITVIYELGRSFGSSLRYIISGQHC